MKDKNFCTCNTTCDFSKDNGYKYILDELKSTRDNINDIINMLENRIEKDALINDVLDGNYDDECDCLSEKEDKKDTEFSVADMAKIIALQEALRENKPYKKRFNYPWWHTYYY